MSYEDSKNKEFFLSLLECKTGLEIENLLKKKGYLDSSKANCWRPLGDKRGNWGTINAHGQADFCLNEKVVNAIDSLLMSKCWLDGHDPETDAKALPTSVDGAVKKFFKDEDSEDHSSHIYWSQTYRKKTAENIFLVAGGDKKNDPIFTIIDKGEGQVPERVPETILSMQEGNKLKVKCSQGKWGQGGSAAMKHCGQKTNKYYQLVISKRNPEIIKKHPHHKYNNTEKNNRWSFSVIRRVEPEENAKRSEACYLAPLNAYENPCRGDLLTFESKELPLLPWRTQQHKLPLSYGTLIKCFDYNSPKGDQIRSKGMRRAIDILLPRSPIPIRFHDATKNVGRDDSTKDASFSMNLEGLGNFIERRKDDNLEDLSACRDFISVEGYKIPFEIFIFKKGKGDTLKGNTGLLWVINGQTHASQNTAFFDRDDLPFGAIKKDMLVIIDCTNLKISDRENVFKSTRDDLDPKHPLVVKIKKSLTKQLKENEGITEIVRKRIASDTENPIQDKRVISQLEKIISKTAIAENLNLGDLLATKTKKKDGPGKTKNVVQRKFPTYFQFKGTKNNKETLKTESHLGSDVRLTLMTDAQDDYFARRKSPGKIEFFWDENGQLSKIQDTGGASIKKGLCRVRFSLKSTATAGSDQNIVIKITDTKQEFNCKAKISIRPKMKKPTSINTTKGTSVKRKVGGRIDDKEKRDLIIARPLDRENWDKKFTTASDQTDKWTPDKVLKVETIPGKEGKTEYVFYYNKEYHYLDLEKAKASVNNPPELIERRYQILLSLYALSILTTHTADKKSDRDEFKVETENGKEKVKVKDAIEMGCRGIAMLILPCVSVANQLGFRGNNISSDEVGE